MLDEDGRGERGYEVVGDCTGVRTGDVRAEKEAEAAGVVQVGECRGECREGCDLEEERGDEFGTRSEQSDMVLRRAADNAVGSLDSSVPVISGGR